MGYLFRAFKKSTKPSIIAIETCISSLVVTLLNTGALLLDNMMYGYTTYVANVPFFKDSSIMIALLALVASGIFCTSQSLNSADTSGS